MIKKLYPNGKTKAFNVTYDDGVLQDIRFVELLNKYNLKGTFNLNSQLMEEEFEWTHENGMVVKRLAKDKVLSLYDGHEVASHTLTHPYMDNLSREEVLHELKTDKVNLEKLFGKEIKGFAAPFDYYSELIERCVKECGFKYARISEESRTFTPQIDYYKWRATVFHLDYKLDELINDFLNTNEELALFQIVGHSYDLDVENIWEQIESIFKKIVSDKNILPMTTIEIIDYLKAMSLTEIKGNRIINNSDISLWFDVDGEIIEIKGWLTPTMKEAPFYHKGITPQEYDEENKYLQTHYDDVLNRKYQPLWKQRINQNKL
ncbi:MAG: polysaccharide deacetylase family protein [Ruminococcus sp.]|nr:polysaccharide deacetylase family protein [Ruminococcus sp.]